MSSEIDNFHLIKSMYLRIFTFIGILQLRSTALFNVVFEMKSTLGYVFFLVLSHYTEGLYSQQVLVLEVVMLLILLVLCQIFVGSSNY